MSKIKLTEDPYLGILTFQNLISEYSDGVPDNWLRCFICRDEAEILPDYNRILFLRNVNIRPMASSTVISPFLPIWHAAVVLANDDEPRQLMFVKETVVLDSLVAEIPYYGLIEHDFPAVNLASIHVELDDLDELPEESTNQTLANIPVTVLKGWPTEAARQSYLYTQKAANEIAHSMGREATVDFTYVVKTGHLDMSLHFTYCMVTQQFNQVFFISDDIMCADEAW